MKIEWLNDEMTEARLTKGWLRRRQAHVAKEKTEDGSAWFYVANGTLVEGAYDGFNLRHVGLCGAIERARAKVFTARQNAAAVARERELAALKAAKNPWLPVSAFPAAKVVRR